MTANDNISPHAAPRSVQKRQRKHSLQIALDDDEFAIVAERAQACGLSHSSYGRAAILGSPGPRARRTPPINAEELARATIALNRAGCNVNSIAHRLNAVQAVGAQEAIEALAEVRAAAAVIREITGRKERR